MRTLTAFLVSVWMFAGACRAEAQVVDDPFKDLHASLRRAVSRELDLALKPSPPGRGPGEGSEFAPIFNPHPALGIVSSSSAFNRLRELLPMMRAVFEEERVPQEFVLVGLVESGYQPDAVSPANAVGIWQFIPSTARRFGLLDGSQDLRTDIVKSTRAAAKYLRLLLDQFGDWPLALAAYNAGEDRVEDAIRAARSRDFRRIAGQKLLPAETRGYVPAVLRAIAQARNLGILSASKNGENDE